MTATIFAPIAGQQIRRDRPDVAESLHGDRRALDVEAEMLRRLARDDHHAAAGGLAAAERAAHLDRLAGDDGRRRVADVHAVGVHHPRHDLIVGVDVGRGHVLLRPDRVDDLGDVAPRQRLELALRHPRRVADDAALAAAEGDVRDRALPRHPGRERRDLVERDVGVIADAALGRTERDVVLDAVAGEDLDLAVVHLHRTRDDDLPLGMREDPPDAGLEVEDAGGAVELLEHRPEDGAVFGHGVIVIGFRLLRLGVDSGPRPSLQADIIRAWGLQPSTAHAKRLVERLYTPESIASLDYERDLADPGQFPYTRGIHATGYRGKLWTMRQFAGFGTPEETNERYKQLLEAGGTGLSVAFDLPTLMGRDPDHELSLGEVGKCGVNVTSLADMETLFDGIDLGAITTSMTINSPASMIFAMYLVVAEKQGRTGERCRARFRTTSSRSSSPRRSSSTRRGRRCG